MQIMHNSAGFGEYPRQTLHNPRSHYAKPYGLIAEVLEALGKRQPLGLWRHWQV